MPSGPCCNGNQAIDACLGSFFGVTSGSDIVKHKAAIAMHGIDDFLCSAKTGDHKGYFVFDANSQVILKPRVAVMHDEVYAVGGRVFQCREPSFDFFQPSLETTALALIERGADWQKSIEDQEAPALVREGLVRHPWVRKEILGGLVPAEDRRNKATPKI